MPHTWTCHLEHPGGEIVCGQEDTPGNAYIAMLRHQRDDHRADHDAVPLTEADFTRKPMIDPSFLGPSTRKA